MTPVLAGPIPAHTGLDLATSAGQFAHVGGQSWACEGDGSPNARCDWQGATGSTLTPVHADITGAPVGTVHISARLVAAGLQPAQAEAHTQVVAPPCLKWWNGSVPGVFGPEHRHLRGKVDARVPGPTCGYRLVATDGGVFAFAQRFGGSIPGVLGAKRLNGAVLGAVAPGTRGYWLVARDGGVFAFGDAHFYGSEPGILAGESRKADVVALLRASDGRGYDLVGAKGDVYAFGPGATHAGSLPAVLARLHERLSSPIVTAQLVPDGYRLVASDGGVFTLRRAE